MVYVRVLCGVRYVFMGLRQEEDITQPMERMTSSGDRRQDCRVQVQVEHHEEIKCLKLAVHCGDNGLLRGDSHGLGSREIFQVSMRG